MKFDPSGIIVFTKKDFRAEFLRQCYQISAEKSDDPSTKTAAIVVDSNGKILASGANSFSVGVQKRPTRLESPQKYKYINHAERNAIFLAAKNGVCTEKATMYMPWLPCLNCANAIIQSGIQQLVTHKNFYEQTPPDWQKELREALEILSEAGVDVLAFEGKIDVPQYFRGKNINS